MHKDLAVAYAVKKRNAKKMASGGVVKESEPEALVPEKPEVLCASCGGMVHMNEGGEVIEKEDYMDDDSLDLLSVPEPEPSSILNRIFGSLKSK